MEEVLKKAEENGVKIVFGLEAQGHIQTIEKIIKDLSGDIEFRGKNEFVDMTYDKYTWEKIGKEIGWCPLTAAVSYFDYLKKKNLTFTKEEMFEFMVYSNKFTDGSTVSQHFEMWQTWKHLENKGLDKPLKEIKI